MVTTRETIIADILYFLKTDLTANITDPLTSKRSAKSKFVMTSYPQRPANYPIITLRITNIEATRAGMQTSAMDMTVPIEVRVWGRNEKEKDQISQSAIDRLADIQYIASGSIDAEIHDFQLLSAVEVVEDGEKGIKSRVITIQYKFFG